MKMIKKGLIASVLLLLVLLIGCSAASNYAADLSAADVARAALNVLEGEDAYMDGTQAYYAYYFEDRPEHALINDRIMLYQKNETNVNEICVFRAATPKDAALVGEAVENYIDEQEDYLEGFAKNYSPEDMKKIENADVEVIGCYVIGYVLSPQDEKAVLDAVRELLTTK